MLPTIQIKDNFLDKKEYEIIASNVDKINYEAINNNSGNFGFSHPFPENSENEWLYKKIKQQFFPNTNLKVSVSSYHWRHNKDKVRSHADPDDFNFILYVKGKELVYNGTGFYHKNDLNTYVGFVENRAIFFDGRNNIHTDLQALGPSSGRYTVNIFYTCG